MGAYWKKYGQVESKAEEFHSIILTLTHQGNVNSVSRTVTVDEVTVVSDTIPATNYGGDFDSTCTFEAGSMNFSLRNYAISSQTWNSIYNEFKSPNAQLDFSFYNSNNNSRAYTDTKEITLLMKV